MAQLDLQKLNKFQEDLSKSGFSKIDQTTPQPLTQQEITHSKPIVIEYYTYLSKNGDSLTKQYAELALGVVRDDTTPGKVANIHMEANAKHMNMGESDLLRLKNEMPVYLAGRDIQMRMDTLSDLKGNPILEHISDKIPDYHYEGFKKLGCDATCWTATTFHKFAGDPTAWFTVATGDNSMPKMELGKIYDAYKANDIKDGISAGDAVNSLARTVNYEFDKNQADYYITVKGKTLFVPPVDPYNPDSYLLDAYVRTNSLKMLPTVVRSIIQDQFKASNSEKISFPNFIKDNPDFTKTESGANKVNQILSKADQDVARKVANILFSEEGIEGSCKAEANTEGSCKAENLDDIQGKGTYFNPNEVQKLYQTLDKKGIILDKPIISDDIRQSSSAHEDLNSKTHVVEKGDTVWSIAHKNEMGVNELLSVSGNEKYLKRRYIDERGKDNIKLYKDDIINLPSSSRSTNNYFDINKLTEGFNRLNQNHQTSFNDKIFGSFELGNYGNYQELQTYLLTPFLKWSSTSQFKTLDEQLQFFKNLGFEKQFQYHNADYKLEQKVEEPLKFFKYFSLEEQYGIHLPADHVFKFEHNNNYRYHSNNYQWKSSVDPMKIRGDGHWETEYYGGSAREQARYVFGNSGFSAGFSISGFGRARPIGVSLDEEDISLVNYEGSSIFFDIDGDGYKENTAWVSSTAAILVYDYNNNGIVDEAKKIVFTEWSKESKTDLEALKKAFDSNNDNIFDSKDKEFDKFYIWQDYNQNGISENNELTKLEEIGIQSINLNIIAENDEGKKNQGILGTSDIIWKNGKITKAYDLIFKHSLLGIKAEQINSDIIINYIEKGDQLKFFVPEVGEGNVNFNSTENDYDVILGTAYDDIINISQSKGVLVDAGEGDDVIKITSGNNWVKGGAGKDSIITGSGHDLLFIDADDIEIDAGEGFDVAFVTGDKGINIDIAKSNIEAIYGGHKNDNIDGSRTNKNLQIHGGDGDDTLIGGSGDDIIVGGKGKDKIIGGKGDDKIFIDNEDNLSDIDAGEGNDTIYLLDETGITIDLDKINAENFFGNKGNDIVIAKGNKDYILFGGEGDDDITGGTSNTILDGGKGNDILRGGSGNNKYIFSLGYGHDTIHAAGKNRGDKKDLVLLSSDIQLQDMKFTRITDDLVLKVKKDDSLTIKNWYKGDSYKVNSFIFQADKKDGGKEIILYDDNDKLNLKDGNDWIVFTTSKEDMLILGGSGNEFIKAGQGNDFIVGWGGNDTIYGGAGNDFIIAWDYRVDADKTTCPQIPCNPKDPVKIYGEEGDDILMGAGGDDLLDGGDGNDTITGLGGNDILITGSGDDIVRATEGNNKIIVNGAGDKTLYSGSGSDEFIIKHMEHGSLITIVNFDMNDQNEKIDFTAIKSLHSLQDFPQIFDYDTTIEFPTIENPNNVETFPCACISWAKSEELYNHCWLVLTDITAEQVLSHPEKFIFGE